MDSTGDPDRSRARALEQLRGHGRDTVSFQITGPDMRYWFDPAPPFGTGACVGYVDTGGAWVAAGGPVVEPALANQAATRFLLAARQAGRRACFFATDRPCGETLERMPLGEQPIFRPAEWPATLTRHRRLREQLRRARAKGVRVRRVDPCELGPGAPLRLAFEALARSWLGARRLPPMHFLVALDPFQVREEHLYFVAVLDEHPIAFLSAVPIYARRGWFAENLVRGPAAPNGTSEALFDALLRQVPESELVTLGLAPLSGRLLPWQRLARTLSKPLYDFGGLRAFKERLHPSAWEPVWLDYPRREAALVHLVDSLRAFAGGHLVRFASRSLLVQPGGLPWALAMSLLPWTALLGLLALLDATAPLGFSRAALAGWTVFDAMLALALFRVASRPRTRALLLLSTVAALDALASVAHLSSVGPGQTLAQGALRSIATIGPVAGTLALLWASWLALRWRRAGKKISPA